MKLHSRFFNILRFKFIFFALFSPLLAANENQEMSSIRQNGTWTVITWKSSTAIWGNTVNEYTSIDLSSFVSNGPVVSAWFVQSRLGLLYRLTIDCENGTAKQDRWYIGGLFGGGPWTLSYDTKFGDGTEETYPTIRSKLCGNVISPIGLIAKYLYSVEGGNKLGESPKTFYWIPSRSSRSLDRVVIQMYQQPDWGPVKTTLSNQDTFSYVEFSCKEQRAKFRPRVEFNTVEKPSNEIPWEPLPNRSIGELARVRLCNDSSIVESTEYLTNNKQIESQSIEEKIGSAVKKCEELGFIPRTEKFGQCVLTISK